ncbi:MAG: peptidoglycan-binding protein [Alphaproteobacteria bacterium]|nr:peptidoglycan-binding protein [Alphaproteobacteria bacterium]
MAVTATIAPKTNAALPPALIGEFQTLNILAPSPLVQRAQELLTELGEYDGPTDGRMNDDTLEAIKAYQRRSGLEDDGRVSEALLDHIEFTGRAIELGEKVERIRTGQIDVAEQALMAQPETRALLEANFDDERADPARDASQCFANPDAECLLTEALNSAIAVNRDRFRDWVLGEIVVVQAQAGLVASAMETAARIGDPRLIIVALGNMATAQARTGAVDQGLLAARVIPDPWARAKALADVAGAMAATKDRQALELVVEEILELSRTLAADRIPAQFLAGLATDVWRQTDDGTDQVLATLSGEILAEAAARIEALDDDGFKPGASGVAVAYAEFGRVSEALEILETLQSDSDRRPVFTALAAAAAAHGQFDAANFYAGEIIESRYRAVTLTQVAAVQAAAGFEEVANGTLDTAMADAMAIDVKQSYARSHAINAVAIAMVTFGRAAEALEAVNAIPDARVQAEALWAVAVAQSDGGDRISAARTAARYYALVASIPSALDRTWVLANGAIRSGIAGNDRDAGSLLSRAQAQAQSITDPWARAQAFSKVATTMVTLAQ